MNTTKVIGALLLSMGLAGTAVAENGFYAGASVGESSVDACGDAGALGFTDCDDSDTGWKIFGGYDLSDNIAVEGAWADLGEMTASRPGRSGGVEVDGFILDAKGTLPLNEQFGVFAKLGFMMWDAEGTGALSGLDDDGTDFHYGIGVQYMFTEQFGIIGEWEAIDLDDDDVDLLSAGALMKF